MKTFSPILAAKRPRDYTDEQWIRALEFPVIATPKLDGIRCVTRNMPTPPGYTCQPLARSLKVIPNQYTENQIGTMCPVGLDGELITYNRDLLTPEAMRPFNQVSSDIMSHGGQPNFKYHVFDSCIELGMPYVMRLNYLDRMFAMHELPSFCVPVPRRVIASYAELMDFERECIEAGYEGICWRLPMSPYKYGRSTLREGYLIKHKRMADEEAEIIGYYEEMANNNPATIGLTGHSERTSHKANMAPKGRLGGFIVKSPMGEHKIGSGFTAADRERYWAERESLVGRHVKFCYQVHGSLNVPRIPIFVGMRSDIDL